MKRYAEEEDILTHSRILPVSSFESRNGALIAPLIIFNLKTRSACTKTEGFSE